MRGLKIGKRSVYRGLKCLYCHRKVGDGRAVLASTYYVCAAFPDAVHTQSQQYWMRMQAKKFSYGVTYPSAPIGADNRYDEIEVRVVYHRRCVEKILLRAPVDPEVEEADFDAYRAELLERFGIDEVDEC